MKYKARESLNKSGLRILSKGTTTEYIFLLVLLIVCFSSQAQAQLHNTASATIKVSTVPNELFEKKAFNLIFQTTDSVDAAPDFSPLEKNFTITHQTQRNSFRMFSSDYNRSDYWIVGLISNTAGSLTIPAIAFGKDRSPGIKLLIKPESEESNDIHGFISELEVSHTQVYLRSQIIVTKRMLSTKRTAQPSFHELKFTGVDIMLEPLNENKIYTVTRDNILYYVLEEYYVLYPQQTGTLTLHPSIAVAQVSANGNGSVNPLTSNSIPKYAASKSVSITIKPFPTEFRENNWLPASSVQLTEQWSNDKKTYNVGEPLIRHLSITVEGQGFSQIPPLPFTTVNDIKRYADNSINQNIISATGKTGSRDSRVILIPTRSGQYTLPSIEVPWWNTNSNALSIASIPSRTITVIDTVVNNVSSKTNTSLANNNIELAAANDKSHFYLWTTIFSTLAWASTLLIFFKQSIGRKRRQEIKNIPQQTSLLQAEKILDQACKNAKAKQCENALLIWGAAFYTIKFSNLGEMKPYLDEPLKTEIIRLEKFLYGSGINEWSADNIKQEIRKQQKPPNLKASYTDLEPMYYQ